MNTSTPFKWRHFQAEIFLLCMRWYLRYPLCYRNLEEMMRERGLHVDHTTVYRWVQHYTPELEKRCRLHLNATNDSWCVDETYVKVKRDVGFHALIISPLIFATQPINRLKLIKREAYSRAGLSYVRHRFLPAA